MRHARRNLQRMARLAAVGGLLCGGFMVSNAVAGEPAAGGAGTDDTSRAAELTGGLVSRLGATRTAGSWIGADGRPVVAVTDEEAAAAVREEGARAKVVRYSLRELREATRTLRESPRVTGTAWSVDYSSNKVVVRADRTVSAEEWSRLSRIAGEIGGSVEMRRTEGAFTTRLNGAEAMFAANGRCSAGFNVTNGEDNYILTAGHCGPVGTPWFKDAGDAEPFGTTVAGRFPGNDFSLIEYQDGQALQNADVVSVGDGKGVRITGAGEPVVGQQVFRSGSSTGFRTGQVTALNATVNYPEGTVTGLIETTVCAEPGDSGGPLFSEGLALGVTSGGNGDCATGGVTYFQPATTALQALGVSLATGSGAGSGSGTGNGASSQAQPEPAPAPPSAAAAPGIPASPGTSGGFDRQRVGELVNFRTLTPGLGVIGGSLVLLVATHWIRERQDRRQYREYYSAGWS
ncbi:S1 family peptidase [Streptomyces sp. GC420]|uniref:S1 family peptidase n=1 Tax=Streptomyces sp. GC420 TaxID=2697568 RepID=UPI001414FDD3|nr:S1 family peptidase [Streptomyces sp. GC420]NBM15691.1 trypsin-like serine protease [Streptomyces sp. GC420]